MADLVPWAPTIEKVLGDPGAWGRRLPPHDGGAAACACSDCAARYPESARARREIEAWLTDTDDDGQRRFRL